MSDPEIYIPSARNAVIAYFGRNHTGNLRCYCVRCNDAAPLTGDGGREAHKVYGDLYVADPAPVGRVEESEQCEACGVALLDLSRSCQREHDEQQSRWARTSAPAVLIEYGIPAMIRCRVY